MERKEFYEAVRRATDEKTGYACEVVEVTKNNGVRLTGIKLHEKGELCAPIIYLDDMYESLGEQADGVMRACNEVLHQYGEHKGAVTDINWINDYKIIRDYIYPKLINRDCNLEMEQEVPGRNFMDLRLVYYIRIRGLAEKASVLIRESMLSVWGCSEDELFETAINNIQGNSMIEPMTDVIYRVSGEELTDSDCDMYIATNRDMYFGAVSMLNKDMLAEFAGSCGAKKLTIIPSSVHEVIILKDTTEDEALMDMLRAVNQEYVSAEEFLSNNLYKFDAERMEYEVVEQINEITK